MRDLLFVRTPTVLFKLLLRPTKGRSLASPQVIRAAENARARL